MARGEHLYPSKSVAKGSTGISDRRARRALMKIMRTKKVSADEAAVILDKKGGIHRTMKVCKQ
jgi:hypothetical protein